ncbi:hypothetical protein SLE2022_340420 [Rubroshorea leprosula]
MMEKKEKESVSGAVVASPAALVGSRDDNEMDAGMQTAETLLRLVLMAVCLSALIVMVKNSQSNTDFGSLSYSDLGAFRYSSLSHIYFLIKYASDSFELSLISSLP